jgi:hypothetical protein
MYIYVMRMAPSFALVDGLKLGTGYCVRMEGISHDLTLVSILTVHIRKVVCFNLQKLYSLACRLIAGKKKKFEKKQTRSQ